MGTQGLLLLLVVLRLRVWATLWLLPGVLAPMTAQRMLQQQEACPASQFAAAAGQVDEACCTVPTAGAGAGHRRLLLGSNAGVASEHRWLQVECDVPTSCPTLHCATTFTAFFRDCQQWIVDVSAPDDLLAYQNLNEDCARLEAQPSPARQCSAMRGDVCDGNSCKRFVGYGMRGRSCAEYCCEFGFGCVGAWEEVDNNCAQEDRWTCQQTEKRGGGTTDDMICECDGDGSTLTAPCSTPAPPPALPSVPPRAPAAASVCCGALPWMDGWLCPGCPASCLICEGHHDPALAIRPCSALRWGQAWSCPSCPTSCTITNRPPLQASDVVGLTEGGTTQLPIVLINTENSARIRDDPRIHATLVTLDSGSNERNSITSTRPTIYEDGWDGTISIEIRGSSSAGFPKKQYGFETQVDSTTEENADVSLLGLPAENDWVLNAPYSDKTLMRNALAYSLAAATGQYAPRTRFCEVVLNGQYKGVYLLVEKIKRDKHRVDVHKFHAGFTPEETGFIVKIDKNTGSQSYRWSGLLVHRDGDRRAGWRPAAFHCDYPKTDDLSQNMRRYIQDYITEFEQRLSEPEVRPSSCRWCDAKSGWFDYIDVPSFVDYMIVQELGKNVDGYRLSTFLHKQAEADGGLLQMGPVWDFNLAFDNSNYGGTHNPEGWTFDACPDCPDCRGNRQGCCCRDGTWSPFPFWWAAFVAEPQFSRVLRCRWDELRAAVFSDASLDQRIDQMRDELGEAQARNFAQWQILNAHVWPNPVVSGSWEAEVDRMRDWLFRRVAWLDANIPQSDADCREIVG